MTLQEPATIYEKVFICQTRLLSLLTQKRAIGKCFGNDPKYQKCYSRESKELLYIKRARGCTLSRAIPEKNREYEKFMKIRKKIVLRKSIFP